MSKKILSIIAMSAALNATAQQDTLSGKTLDPVIITANKVEQKQSTTGKVITVISKEQIEKSNGKTVAQLLNEQAGITINGAYNNAGSVQTLYMRGANAGRALILLDGIPINDPSTITNDFDLNLFSINDVEKIEICKGAQSTLYGSDAIAGVVNIITVKGNISKTFGGKATVAAGNFNTYKANVQLYGKVDKLTYTARYAKLKTDGFSSAYDSTGTKGFDNDQYDGNMANATLQYQANKQLLFKTFGMFSQYKAGVDAGTFTDKQNYDINNRNFTTGAGVVYKNDVVTLTGNYQYNILNRNYNDNASIAGATAYSLNDYNGIGQFAELYANIKLNKNFTLLQGGDFRYGSFNNSYKSQSSFGPYNSDITDLAMSQSSMYASLLFNSNKVNIELGGRLNVHSRYGSNYTYTFNPSYTIDKNYRIFGSIATGFKSPSLYQLYAGVTQTGNFGPGNPDLKPEQSINYELGVQQQYKNFSNRLVFFYRNTDNGIDYLNAVYPAPSLYFNYINQKVSGIEYEVAVKPIEKLNITANYTLLMGDETTQNRFTLKDTISYNYLLRRPKHNVNVTLGWQALQQLYISVSGKYVSSRFDIGGYKKQDIALNDYFLVNAYAAYTLTKQIKFFADAQNLGNTKFFDIRGYNAIPFMLNVGVTVSF